ncbi:SDR family NAD(P)-dependent oxidoreductase [Pseudonocardia sp. RS010]|uniref:SDR family NAD(P)-dependent oxidoreductase n=1 Tax=Pseudonocardia sp. RS010 TaxID=3385979 RepID=UPI00399F2B8B
MSGRLEGEVALRTGAARGMGRASALRFAAEGATVVGCDLRKENLDATVAEVTATGGRRTGTAPVDLGDSGQTTAWIDAAAAEHGGIDVPFNNASAPRFAPLTEMSDEDWHFDVRNELDLVFFACRAAWSWPSARRPRGRPGRRRRRGRSRGCRARSSRTPGRGPVPPPRSADRMPQDGPPSAASVASSAGPGPQRGGAGCRDVIPSI